MEMPKLDKTVLTVTSYEDVKEERQYWHKQSPYRRLQAIQLLRELNYGRRAVSGRLQRLLEVVERPSS